MTDKERQQEVRIIQLEQENAALTAQLEGDIPKATAWLQRKVWSQRTALARLNQRVVNQRFVLRALNELGRSLSAEEYKKAREALGNEQVRAMVEEKQQ